MDTVIEMITRNKRNAHKFNDRAQEREVGLPEKSYKGSPVQTIIV